MALSAAQNRLVIGSRRYSSWSLRGWLAVHLAGLEVDEHIIPLAGGSTPAVKALSPSGMVPFLQHDGALVWDSIAILEYCAEHHPPLWPAERIARAVREGEPVAVYGDYDVDGLTATHLLCDFITRSGGRAVPFVPDRLTCGYGLSCEAVRGLSGQGVRLLVTVDCGVADHAPVRAALECGLEVVVTDHHLPQGDLPQALAVVNPKRLPPDHPLFHLSGVGVAFYVAAAVRAELRACGWYDGAPEPNLREYLDLAAFGTVADVMPLLGANRVLVSQGLREIERGGRPSVEALRRICGGGREDPVTPWDISFRFAPRINAASRLGRQDLVLRWLAAGTPEAALECATEMDRLNRSRATIEAAIIGEAVSMVEEDPHLRDAPLLFLAREGWHHGILGLAAQRIVERYRRPAILVSRKNGRWEGSGRSTGGFHLHEALRSCAGLLDRFGGHALAVGLSVAEGRLQEVRRALEAYARERFRPAEPALSVLARLSLAEVDEETLGWLERLGPFGPGCPEPVFVAENLEVVSVELVKGEHLRMTLSQGGARMGAMGFRLGGCCNGGASRLRGCAFVPERRVWRGESSIRLRIVDIATEGAP